MEGPYLSRKEIIRSIRFARKFGSIVLVFFLLLVVMFIAINKYIGSILLADAVVFGTFVGCTYLLCKFWYKRFGNYNIKLNPNKMTTQILWVFMNEQFENVEFNIQKQLPEDMVRLPGFSFAEESTVYRASNYATASLGPMPIEAQATILGNIESYANLSQSGCEGSARQALDTKFSGMLYLCHTGKAFSPTTVHTGKKQNGETKTGDENFDRLFSVQTLDPRTTPLSDRMRRFLTEAAGNIHCKVYIHFAANGDIYFAFNQRVYEDTPKKDLKAFEKLEFQAHLIKGLLNELDSNT